MHAQGVQTCSTSSIVVDANHPGTSSAHTDSTKWTLDFIKKSLDKKTNRINNVPLKSLFFKWNMSPCWIVPPRDSMLNVDQNAKAGTRLFTRKCVRLNMVTYVNRNRCHNKAIYEHLVLVLGLHWCAPLSSSPILPLHTVHMTAISQFPRLYVQIVARRLGLKLVSIIVPVVILSFFFFHRYEFGPPKFFSKSSEFFIIFYSTWQISGGCQWRKAADPGKRIFTVGNDVKTVGTC